jgi:TonB-linked SusC/RagA family outer membrane protein
MYRHPVRAVLAAITFVIVAGLPSIAVAQATGRITGQVTDAAGGRPVPDAQVVVIGADRGAVTNSDGRYRIENVPAGTHQLRTRKIGYSIKLSSVSVPDGGELVVNTSIQAAPTQLNEVVVTGAPGSAQKRTLGNAVTQLNVADVTSKTTVTTVGDVLQGRSPGVIVSAGSGSPGTSSEITVRGYGSFTNNRPVVYIDGVRMDIEDIGAFNPSGAGTGGFSGQRTSALDLVNPNDIESIEVIRGPAASTLYGADAASGVIQILTKRGQRGQQALKWSTRFETGHNEWGTETLTNYTTCTQARIDAVDAAGNKLWIGCQGVPANTILTDDPLRRDPLALRSGKVNNLSMSVRGGGDRYSFYISGDKIGNGGVLENNFDDRRSVRTNFSFNPSNEADFQVNVGYTHQRLRLPLGDEAGNGLLLSAVRGIPGLTRPRPSLNGWGTIEPALAHLYNNTSDSDRLILGSTINYTPFQWLRNRLTVGMDWRVTTAQVLSLPGDPDVPAGLNALREPKVKSYTVDYAGTVLTTLSSDLKSETSFGTQVSSRRDERIDATGTSLPTREITTIGGALSVSGANSFSEFNSVGVFAQQQLGWRDRLYVTGALRADDHSSFGSDFDIIVYPKASVSWVLSEEPMFDGFLNAIRANSFRVRGAWGRAGRAPAPFSAVQTYGSTRVATSPTIVGGALVASAYGNPDLKPETGTEIELGFDSDYLNGRVGLEFTWYRKVMKDLFAPLALPPSLGFAGSVTQNLGQTTNRGAELGLRLTPVSTRNFVWDGSFSLATNKNRLDQLDTIRVCRTWVGETCAPTKGIAEDIPGGASYSGGMQRSRVGYPLGAYWSRLPSRDANGNYILNRNAAGVITTPVYDTAFTFIGPAVPTKQWSLSNTFTVFRNFRLYGMLDYQGGHYLYNQKSYNRCATVANGPNCALLNDPALIGTARLDTLRAVFAGGGVSTPLTVTAPMTQSQYVEKADFIKLRDVSLTYTLPSRIAQGLKMETASITVAGKNLALWTDYSGLDPEVNGYSNNQLRGSGNNAQFVRVDAYSWPMIRRWTMQFNLTY